MIVLVALLVFSAGVFVVDYAFGELFRFVLDTGTTTTGAGLLPAVPTTY